MLAYPFAWNQLFHGHIHAMRLNAIPILRRLNEAFREFSRYVFAFLVDQPFRLVFSYDFVKEII
jgi:hypothetical protein